MMKIEKENRFNSIVNSLQLVVLVVGLASISAKFGAKDNQLSMNTTDIIALQSISTDLVKAQVLSQAKDGEQSRLIIDILRRLSLLERR